MTRYVPGGTLLPPRGGRICIVLLTGIGDVVHGLPLVNAIRAARPDLRITWVAEAAPAEVLHHHPSVDEVIVFRKKEGLRGLLRLRSQLRASGPYDLAINAQRYFKSIFPTLFSRAPVRVGLSRDKTRDGVSLINTHHLPDGPWRHTQDILLDFLPLLGLPRPERPTWNFTFSEDEERAAADYFRAHAGRRVGVVIATANPKKDWPAAYYTPLVDALAERWGVEVFLIGGPSERERAIAAVIVRDARRPPVVALADSVRVLMWRIRGMHLLISPDTGPVHIARAMEIPVIGLYGHTNPVRVGPYRAFENLILDRYHEPGEVPGPGGYESKDGRMERITPDDVLEKVRIALEPLAPGERFV